MNLAEETVKAERLENFIKKLQVENPVAWRGTPLSFEFMTRSFFPEAHKNFNKIISNAYSEGFSEALGQKFKTVDYELSNSNLTKKEKKKVKSYLKQIATLNKNIKDIVDPDLTLNTEDRDLLNFAFVNDVLYKKTYQYK